MVGILLGARHASVSEEGLLYFPTVKSKVTRGVIICDVETDVATYRRHSHPDILCTAIWSPGAQVYDSHYVCVCVCLLSYGWVPPRSHGLSEYS